MVSLNHGMAYFAFYFSVTVPPDSGRVVHSLDDSPLRLRTSRYKGKLRYST